MRGGGEESKQVLEVEEGEDHLQTLDIIGDLDEDLVFPKSVEEETIQPRARKEVSHKK